MGSFSIAVGGDVGDHDLSSRRNSFHAALEEGRAHLEELKAQVAGAGDIPDQELNLGMLMSLLCFTKKLGFEVDPPPSSFPLRPRVCSAAWDTMLHSNSMEDLVDRSSMGSKVDFNRSSSLGSNIMRTSSRPSTITGRVMLAGGTLDASALELTTRPPPNLHRALAVCCGAPRARGSDPTKPVGNERDLSQPQALDLGALRGGEDILRWRWPCISPSCSSLARRFVAV